MSRTIRNESKYRTDNPLCKSHAIKIVSFASFVLTNDTDGKGHERMEERRNSGIVAEWRKGQ